MVKNIYRRLRRRTRCLLLRPVVVAFVGLILVLMAGGALSPPLPLPVAPPLVAVLPTAHAFHEYVIAREAERVGLDTALAIAISRRENPRSDLRAWSYNDCCVGLMQINVKYKGTGWLGKFVQECRGGDVVEDMYDPRINACYGVRIFVWHLGEEHGDTTTALGAYSGFARRYAERVLAEQAKLVEPTS